MRILVLGGDGYLGWPQALYLSQQGYEVAVFDNMARRHLSRRCTSASQNGRN
jgi:UDP-sulfoquinovose synthase